MKFSEAPNNSHFVIIDPKLKVPTPILKKDTFEQVHVVIPEKVPMELIRESNLELNPDTEIQVVFFPGRYTTSCPFDMFFRK